MKTQIWEDEKLFIINRDLQRLIDNKMEMRKDTKRVNYGNFDMVEVYNGNEIMMGYFCMSDYNSEKEASKYISSYLINNSNTTYQLIEGTQLKFTPELISMIEQTMEDEYLKLTKILGNYDSHVFTVNMQ